MLLDFTFLLLYYYYYYYLVYIIFIIKIWILTVNCDLGDSAAETEMPYELVFWTLKTSAKISLG